jgi:tyrosine phenol-lyase
VSDLNGGDRKTVVMKIGGSVLTGRKSFRRVAQFLKHRLETNPNEKLVVVVSAERGATDTMERQARGIVAEPSVRTLDLLWSTGELRSVALVALHLQAAGVSGVGFSVHETGLQFASNHQPCPARPRLASHHLETALGEHAVVVVPGFLAVRWDGTVVSLGRGGSDFSAVLLAVGLRAARCELVKDVPGYFEDDPHKNSRAAHLPSLSFEEAIRMAQQGCELLQMPALLAAGEAGVALVIRSMDERAPVTIISRAPESDSKPPREPVTAEAWGSGMDLSLPMFEPFRAKAVEPIRQNTRAEREAALERAHFNLFHIEAHEVLIDLLTDSGTAALSAAQWGASIEADESYAGSASFRRFDSAVREIFGFPHIVPAHQGRAAERLMMGALCMPGGVVPGNTHFETTRANLLSFRAYPVDLPSPEFWRFTESLPFKGNMDGVALERFLRSMERGKVPFVLLTITNNSCGDQPVSIENIREIRSISSSHGVPLYFDACRFAENAWFIKERERGFAEASIRAIVKEMFSYADGCLFSAKKDGLSHMGGFFATRSEAVAERAQELMLLSEGFLTYGGMTGRDLDTIAIGLGEVLEEEYLRYRIDTTRYLADRLMAEGVPVLLPPGGHAVYIDASQIVPHLRPEENPGQALSIEIYREGGVRTARLVVAPGPEARQQGRVELVRLALPPRVYSRNHLEYAARVVGNVARSAKKISGVRTISAPRLLGGFLACYERDTERQDV